MGVGTKYRVNTSMPGYTLIDPKRGLTGNVGKIPKDGEVEVLQVSHNAREVLVKYEDIANNRTLYTVATTSELGLEASSPYVDIR